MDVREAVGLVLEKRFGVSDPEQIQDIDEINVFENLGGEQLGVGVEIVLKDQQGSTIKEEYQIDNDGVIYSWGNTPVIDVRSMEKKPDLDK